MSLAERSAGVGDVTAEHARGQLPLALDQVRAILADEQKADHDVGEDPLVEVGDHGAQPRGADLVEERRLGRGHAAAPAAVTVTGWPDKIAVPVRGSTAAGSRTSLTLTPA